MNPIEARQRGRRARRAPPIGLPALAVMGGLSAAPPTARAAEAGQVVLLDRGESSARVVLAPRPEAAERHAADEFRRILSALAGGRRAPAASTRVLIGRLGVHPGLDEVLGGAGQAKPLAGDAFRIRSIPAPGGPLLALAGGTPRACLYAVYALFERYAGAGLFADGERIPRLERLALGPVDLLEAPAFGWRQVFSARQVPVCVAYWDPAMWRSFLDGLARGRWNRLYFPCGRDWLLDEALAGALPGRFAPFRPTPAQARGIEKAQEIARLARSRGIELVVDGFDGRLPPGATGGLEVTPALLRDVARAWSRAVEDTFAGVAPVGCLIAPAPCEGGGHDPKVLEALVEGAGGGETPPLVDCPGAAEGEGAGGEAPRGGGVPREAVVIGDGPPDAHGGPWALRIGPTQPHMSGDLVDLARRLDAARKHARCVGLVFQTSSLLHNPLYIDYASRASFQPRDPEAFLEGFIARRYGGSETLTIAWQVTAKALYGPAQLPPPFFQVRPSPEILPRARETLYRIQPLAFAIELGLSAAPRQKGNPLYRMDMAGLAREYLVARAALWWVRVEEAAEAEDVKALRRARRDLGRTLDDLEKILAALPTFSIAPLARCAETLPAPPAGGALRRLREILVCPKGLDRYPEDLDRNGDVLYELVHAYYRPRLRVYLDALERSVSEGTLLDMDRVEEAYRRAAEAFVAGEGWPPPPEAGQADIAETVRGIFRRHRHLPRPVFRPTAEAIANGGFEQGFRPWRIYWNGEVTIRLDEKDPGEGRRALAFRIDPSPGEARDLEVVARVRPRDPFRVRLLARLDEVSKAASASCRVEGYDAHGIKRAQVVIHWGGENWDHGTVTPDRTTGFYATKRAAKVPLKAWTEIAFDPAHELDRAHGPGTWRDLGIEWVAISLRAWILERGENHIAGAFDGVRIEAVAP